jgi:hypothetical protein
MTDTQMLIILGTIWVAPYVNQYYGLTVGCIFLIVGSCYGLGWL